MTTKKMKLTKPLPGVSSLKIGEVFDAKPSRYAARAFNLYKGDILFATAIPVEFLEEVQ